MFHIDYEYPYIATVIFLILFSFLISAIQLIPTYHLYLFDIPWTVFLKFFAEPIIMINSNSETIISLLNVPLYHLNLTKGTRLHHTTTGTFIWKVQVAQTFYYLSSYIQLLSFKVWWILFKWQINSDMNHYSFLHHLIIFQQTFHLNYQNHSFIATLEVILSFYTFCWISLRKFHHNFFNLHLFFLFFLSLIMGQFINLWLTFDHFWWFHC